MPKFAANLSMMFTELPFLDRFDAAADAGFEAVEYLFPYDFPAERLAERLERNGLQQVLFNLPPGDWDAGERGLAALAGREKEFRESVDKALDYARALNCTSLHGMAGVLPGAHERRDAWETYVANLRIAGERLAQENRTLLIEPINTRDIPGYFLNRAADAHRIIETVHLNNLRLQLDLYHCQIMEGDLAVHIRELRDITHHIQIAGVPERHEPDVGEINYPYLFELIDEVGYQGWIGCEYRPKGKTTDGLGWFHKARG